MEYIGTRDEAVTASSSEAILKGICEDGGLFVPKEIPVVHERLADLCTMGYQELAYEILSCYFTDFTKEELQYCISQAYNEKFDTSVVAPLTEQGDYHFLELFHGRTLAFKDIALSILPYLMKTAAQKNGLEKEIVILAATSGDTGKAALEGFAGVPGTRIVVFFPEDGVSPVQKKQMVTQEGENTYVVGIRGNFDDAQAAVKGIFTDTALKEEIEGKGFCFSSANSINIGRLVPQIVYYFYAYGQLVQTGKLAVGEPVNFAVPTGNFGNILAGYYAKCMGLPIHRLICASNDNKVLYDFFKTGVYDKNRPFFVTVSPSMDILVSSNLERLLHKMCGAPKTKECMELLASQGQYETEITESVLLGQHASREETMEAIRQLYKKTGYIMDPHTAVAYASYEKYIAETKDRTRAVIVSTASPYKFAGDVLAAIDPGYGKETAPVQMESLEKLSGKQIPKPVAELFQKPVRHKDVCGKEEIKEYVKKYLYRQ